jgi:uncharacterized damage-inducible protein DinB
MTNSADMYADNDPRHHPPLLADERTMLAAFLTFQRETLETKCAGLDAEQLARRAIPPSSMSLLGLVRHLADVERAWFRRVLAAQDAPPVFYTKENRDGDFDGAAADPELVQEALSAWRSEIAFAEQFVAEAPDLDVSGNESYRGAISLRWVLVHMIEEYARHNGHADLLRELVDGAVGE